MKRKRETNDASQSHLLLRLMQDQKDIAQSLLLNWLRADDLINLTLAKPKDDPLGRVINFLFERNIFCNIFGGFIEYVTLVKIYTKDFNQKEYNALEKVFQYSATTPMLTFMFTRLLNDPRVNVAADNNAAFNFACQFGNVDAAKVMLNETPINLVDDFHWALDRACDNGQLEIVKLLVTDAGVDTKYALETACYHNQPKIVQCLLLELHVAPAVGYNSMFYMAVAGKAVDVAKLLITNPRINPADDENHLFYIAVGNNDSKMSNLPLTDARVRNVLPPELVRVYNENQISTHINKQIFLFLLKGWMGVFIPR